MKWLYFDSTSSDGGGSYQSAESWDRKTLQCEQLPWKGLTFWRINDRGCFVSNLLLLWVITSKHNEISFTDNVIARRQEHCTGGGLDHGLPTTSYSDAQLSQVLDSNISHWQSLSWRWVQDKGTQHVTVTMHLCPLNIYYIYKSVQSNSPLNLYYFQTTASCSTVDCRFLILFIAV